MKDVQLNSRKILYQLADKVVENSTINGKKKLKSPSKFFQNLFMSDRYNVNFTLSRKEFWEVVQVLMILRWDKEWMAEEGEKRENELR